uniref:SWIM-type domain-containing protein n=1 Tax=Setaria italica TaxID=4555 RepID=K3YLA0_SETIT
MNEAVEFFDGPTTFTDLVDRAMRKYGCRVHEMTLRGRFDCGKARAHYVLMNLASDSNWKHYKDVVHKANVACLEVVVEIVHMPSPNVVLSDEVAVVNRNGTQESEILQHVLGDTESTFDLAIANDDFPNDTFERDEANIDDDDISMGSEGSEFKDDGVEDVEGEEESPSQSGGHKNEDEESQYQEDAPQFDTATVHDVEGIGRMDEYFSYTQNELRLLKERDVELPSVPNDKDISMVHKAICESSMVNFEGIPFNENPVIKKGMKFKSLEELKFSWLTTHKDVIGVYVHVQCTAKYLGRRILGIIRKDSETSVPSVVESIFAFSGYRVKYSKAWQAKQHVVALLWGDWRESYGMVPRVLTAMAYYNPRVEWFTDSLCMISDRHHGLLNCANNHMDGFPPLVHRWCMRHFAANMSRWQKNDRVIGKLNTLCKVHTETEFDEKLEDLVKDLNDDAKEWLKGEIEDEDKWAQAFNEGGMHWGIMTTNYSESLNVVFKGIRSRPISGVMEYSFEKCNIYFVDQWQKARAMLDEGHRIGKVADEFISEAELRSVHHLPELYGPERMVYSIRGSGTTNVGVSCTCNVPQLLHLSCSHFITACKARGLNYESPLYMSPLYSREHTVRIWEYSFQPYLDPSQWPPYEGVKYVPNPNLMRNKVGRRQKKHLRGDMDVSQGRLSAHYGTSDFDVDKMAVPAYPLLEAMYDSQHHAHHLANLHEDLKPLQARVHSPFRWDERYAHYLQRAGFLNIAVQVVVGLAPMDGPLLTAMIDRWHPETHTFHLPFGEMTITMQDVPMILSLSLEGTFLLDAAGNTVSWMVLPLLDQDWDNICLYSWGSAVLAWLYRQLCEACRCTARDSNIGGYAYIL